MGITIREKTAKASAQTIWNTCFTEMKWEIWDPDVKKLKNVQPDSQGNKLYDGCQFTFDMKTGMELPGVVEMVEYKSLVFKGSFFKGLAGYEGKIVLTPVENASVTETHIKYSFGMNGVLGSLLSRINAKAVEEGTVNGLDNIVCLSEEAEQK